MAASEVGVNEGVSPRRPLHGEVKEALLHDVILLFHVGGVMCAPMNLFIDDDEHREVDVLLRPQEGLEVFSGQARVGSVLHHVTS